VIRGGRAAMYCSQYHGLNGWARKTSPDRGFLNLLVGGGQCVVCYRAGENHLTKGMASCRTCGAGTCFVCVSKQVVADGIGKFRDNLAEHQGFYGMKCPVCRRLKGMDPSLWGIEREIADGTGWKLNVPLLFCAVQNVAKTC
jgi:hypothetical protein